MPTYTFFTEREGGTYISQFDKPDLLTAWDAFVADENARSGIPLDERDDDPPVAVETVQGVWCQGRLDNNDNYVSVHIIKTDTSGPDEGVRA